MVWSSWVVAFASPLPRGLELQYTDRSSASECLHQLAYNGDVAAANHGRVSYGLFPNPAQ